MSTKYRHHVISQLEQNTEVVSNTCFIVTHYKTKEYRPQISLYSAINLVSFFNGCNNNKRTYKH